ncbi:phosphate uptake regulator, PhoU [Roseovarius nanhaiticus]|uniref:Phosphate-specific transport system accessory protein PhoU n=1 Tax=Roseovarius nanhaiticus TaxID=573024 RepID=A0A1N7ENE5_9RHOB|nr:phosphate signaling complex protein PhoU [Roseovarius nanhaiticus]SEK70696.1 phosphate uptake regulator, PhoU [Roseovarius nanhaiticus]SIR89597.1 phosphate uptake regulator, PhoU [Roseovarius nanhaiticus]
MSQHITSAFDRDLETVEVLITRMGGLVEQAILDAASALEAQDEEAAQEVRRADRAIDALEDQLNDEAARIIALRAPMGVDLRAILGVIKISGNLERIGDYAKNMAKRTTVLAGMPQVEGGTAALRRMAREVQRLLKDALDAYVRRDADLAREVLARDAEIDQMYNAAFRELLTFMLEDTRNITPCMHLHFIAKNTERMGDHVTAIAEQVIYMVTGQHPDDDRPKGDATSVDAKISQT